MKPEKLFKETYAIIDDVIVGCTVAAIRTTQLERTEFDYPKGKTIVTHDRAYLLALQDKKELVWVHEDYVSNAKSRLQRVLDGTTKRK